MGTTSSSAVSLLVKTVFAHSVKGKQARTAQGFKGSRVRGCGHG